MITDKLEQLNQDFPVQRVKVKRYAEGGQPKEESEADILKRNGITLPPAAAAPAAPALSEEEQAILSKSQGPKEPQPPSALPKSTSYLGSKARAGAGLLEAGANLATSAVLTPYAGVMGLSSAIAGGAAGAVMPGPEGQAADWAREWGGNKVRQIQSNIYQPETEEGKAVMKVPETLMSPFTKAGEAAGDYYTSNGKQQPLAGAIANADANLVPALLGKVAAEPYTIGKGPIADIKRGSFSDRVYRGMQQVAPRLFPLDDAAIARISTKRYLEAAKADGVDPIEFALKADEMRRATGKDVSFADIAGADPGNLPNLRKLGADSLADSSDRYNLTTNIRERASGQQPRVVEDAASALGASVTKRSTTFQQLNAVKRQEANYDGPDGAWASAPDGISMDNQPELARLWQRPDMQRAWVLAQEEARNRPEGIHPSGLPTLRDLDVMKQHLNDEATAHFRDGRTRAGTNAETTRRELTDWLDANGTPEYKNARAQWGDYSEMEKQYRAGYDFAGDDTDRIKQIMRGGGPNATAYSSGIVARMGEMTAKDNLDWAGSNILQNNQIRERLQAAMGDDAFSKFEKQLQVESARATSSKIYPSPNVPERGGSTENTVYHGTMAAGHGGAGHGVSATAHLANFFKVPYNALSGRGVMNKQVSTHAADAMHNPNTALNPTGPRTTLDPGMEFSTPSYLNTPDTKSFAAQALLQSGKPLPALPAPTLKQLPAPVTGQQPDDKKKGAPAGGAPDYSKEPKTGNRSPSEKPGKPIYLLNKGDVPDSQRAKDHGYAKGGSVKARKLMLHARRIAAQSA